MTRLNVDDARSEALFASGSQRSDALSAASVAALPQTRLPGRSRTSPSARSRRLAPSG
jgi:hypothetical protein